MGTIRRKYGIIGRMNPTLEKIASDRERYSCIVKTLGECKIDSPVRHHEFVREGERIVVTIKADDTMQLNGMPMSRRPFVKICFICS